MLLRRRSCDQWRVRENLPSPVRPLNREIREKQREKEPRKSALCLNFIPLKVQNDDTIIKQMWINQEHLCGAQALQKRRKTVNEIVEWLLKMLFFNLPVIYWKTSDWQNSTALENLFIVGIWIAPFRVSWLWIHYGGEIMKTKRCTKLDIF